MSRGWSLGLLWRLHTSGRRLSALEFGFLVPLCLGRLCVSSTPLARIVPCVAMRFPRRLSRTSLPLRRLRFLHDCASYRPGHLLARVLVVIHHERWARRLAMFCGHLCDRLTTRERQQRREMLMATTVLQCYRCLVVDERGKAKNAVVVVPYRRGSDFS